MLRRFVLVGLFVTIEPGSILQIFLGALVCAVFLLVQLQSRPYCSMSNNYLALTSSFSLLVLFMCSILYKYDVLTASVELRDTMSLEQRDDYLFSQLMLTVILSLSVSGSLIVSGILLVVQISEAALVRARARRLVYLNGDQEVPISKEFMRSAKRLEEMITGSDLYKKDDKGNVVEEAAPLPTAGPFHVFLSHSRPLGLKLCATWFCSHQRRAEPFVTDWKHGQAKMRIIKKALREMLPGTSVFLECAQ